MKDTSRQQTNTGAALLRLAARAWPIVLLASTLSVNAYAAQPGRRAVQMADVALRHPDNRLEGLVTGEPNLGPCSLGGLKVVLRRRGRVAAETRTDPKGRFAVSRLAAGVYLIEVYTPGGTFRRPYRVWVPGSAPPASTERVLIHAQPVLVRGNGPVPSIAVPDAILIGAVVVGAVAIPFIYDSVSDSHKAPASP